MQFRRTARRQAQARAQGPVWLPGGDGPPYDADVPSTRRAAAPDHDVRTAQLREGVRDSLGVIPAGFVLTAIGLAIVMRNVDLRVDSSELPGLFDGDADAAQAFLGVIATSIMTLTTLVISVTVVALQLASQQFSPRVLRTFFRDTGTKVALGIFTGTFMYSLVVLLQVRGGGPPDQFIPTTSIDVALVLVVVSLAAFVYYVNHVVHAIRIVSIIDAVAAETRAAIREVQVQGPAPAPSEVPDRAPDLTLTFDRRPGTIVTVDEDDLVRVAQRRACLIRLVPRMGEYVPLGAPLAEVWGDHGIAPDLTAEPVLSHIGLNRERTMHQDIAFGFRQLVDISEKALSPAINDPTTAAEALDRIHDLLRRVAASPTPSGYHRDSDGDLRLVHPVMDWAGLVALACDEIRTYGGGALQIQRHMRSMLTDLLDVAGPEQRPPLERQLRLLDRAAEIAFPDDDERDSVHEPVL